MGLVYGIPTVIGGNKLHFEIRRILFSVLQGKITISGLSGSQFLSSIEQFDKSSASWNVPFQRDWRITNLVLNSPRYGMALAAIPAGNFSVMAL
jgi:hypothetical protein